MHALNANAVGDGDDYQVSAGHYQPGTNSGTSLVPEQRLKPLDGGDTSPAAKQAATDNQEGFSDFFDTTALDAGEASGMEPGRNQDGTKPVQILSLKEAVEFYKISEKTIRLHIKDGKIPARKEEGPRGLEWRIYPEGIPGDITAEELTSPEPPFVQPGSDVDETVTTVEENATTVEPVRFQPGTSTESNWYTDAHVINGDPAANQPSFAPELKSLLDVITKQAEKLEAASMRIGYLEARTENYETQIKLLTDSQHQRGWWARFGSWLLGQK